jgi:hypothetical protein
MGDPPVSWVLSLISPRPFGLHILPVSSPALPLPFCSETNSIAVSVKFQEKELDISTFILGRSSPRASAS